MSQMSTLGRVATTVRTNEHGETVVTYHSTPVVTFDQETITLDTGGWYSQTTKTRMNQASNQFALGYWVFQKNFHWFVQYYGRTIPFEGRTLTLRRRPEVQVRIEAEPETRIVKLSIPTPEEYELLQAEVYGIRSQEHEFLTTTGQVIRGGEIIGIDD